MLVQMEVSLRGDLGSNASESFEKVIMIFVLTPCGSFGHSRDPPRLRVVDIRVKDTASHDGG
jgi:hypothetical protein